MIKHYIKTILRITEKNKVSVLINIFGLAIGMAACLFILQYTWYEQSFDRFHPNHESTYRVTFQDYRNGELQRNSASNIPAIGPFIKEKFPEVKTFARVHPFLGLTIRHEDKKFREDRVLMVEPEFLNVFNFPLIAGDKSTALNDLRSIILTEGTALKYFGSKDVLGKRMSVDGDENYTVTGVLKDPPKYSHIQFDFLISYETIIWWSEGAAATDWGWNLFYTYIVTEPNLNAELLEDQIDHAVYQHRSQIFDGYNYRFKFQLQPLTQIHLYSDLEWEITPDEQGDGNTVHLLMIIGVLVLIIGWINYINLSTARSIDRAKEVGIRKTLGALRWELTGQFMTESFVVNICAFFIALVFLFITVQIFKVQNILAADFSCATRPDFWLITIGILAIGTTLSGLYPAFVLSSFQPMDVLKGKSASSLKGQLLRRFLVLFQFAASVMLIAGTFVIFEQLKFITEKDLGFKKDQRIVFRGPGYREDEVNSQFISSYQSFINMIRQFPEVHSVTFGSGIPGVEIVDPAGIKRAVHSKEDYKVFQTLWVDHSYLSVLGIQLQYGRDFNPNLTADNDAVIVNELAATALGFSSAESAINEKINIGLSTKTWTIIGVINNYNHLSVKTAVEPILIGQHDDTPALFYVIKTSKEQYSVLLKKLEKHYQSYYPRDPFDYFFLDDHFNRQYRDEQQLSTIFLVFTSLTVLVAALGLYGLSSFNANRRKREIGIRKVLGAGINQIVMLLSREYLGVVFIANILALPIIYLLMNKWLDSFASRISIEPAIFLWTAMIVVIISFSTVAHKTIISASNNPVDVLRNG